MKIINSIIGKLIVAVALLLCCSFIVTSYFLFSGGFLFFGFIAGFMGLLLVLIYDCLWKIYIE